MNKRIGALITGLISAFAVIASPAMAAKVRKTSIVKRKIALDLAHDEKADLHSDVCLYNKTQQKLACGRSVALLNNNILIIRFADEEAVSKFKKGMELNVKSESAHHDDSRSKSKFSISSNPQWRFSLGWDFAVALAAGYNQLGYLPVTQGSTPNSLWSTSAPVNAAIDMPPNYYGFVGEVGIPLFQHQINLGLRYQLFKPSLVSRDYNDSQTNPYVSAETKAQAMGVWGDFELYRTALGQSFGLSFLSGLDLNATTVNLAATRYDTDAGTSSNVATATANLTLISLRLGGRIDALVAGPVGLSLGATAIVPIFALTNSFSANFADGEDRGLADPQGDMKAQLGLQKKSFGLEVLLGTFVSF
jgi:hypothetical protein